jgi:TonB family protein
MKRILLVAVVVFLGLSCPTAYAQTTQADLSARLIGQPLFLRGFWLDDKLRFDATGQPHKKYKVGSFTQSGFDAEQVELKDDQLKIVGQRVGVVFDHDLPKLLPLVEARGSNSTSPEKVTIEIDGHGNSDFSAALDAIFASGLGQLTPSLPELWQPFAQKHFLGDLQQPSAQKPSGANASSDVRVMHVGGSIHPPKVLQQVNPEFSETSRRQKYSGNCTLYLWVEADGMPTHIAVAKAAGLGLDEAAVKAVSQYRFQPATKDGQAVVVDMYVDVNFQIF